jgi:hypothetical protein
MGSSGHAQGEESGQGEVIGQQLQRRYIYCGRIIAAEWLDDKLKEGVIEVKNGIVTEIVTIRKGMSLREWKCSPCDMLNCYGNGVKKCL